MFKGLSLERLESFLAVADAGGFADAAPRNPVRQSQLSRQVSELERYFGGRKLVERRGRGIVVTAAGERLATVVREMKEGFAGVRAMEDDAPLRFSLGGGDSVLHWWVVPRLAALRDQLPHALPSVISLSSSEVVTRLEDARLDFGLVRAREVPKTLTSRPLGTLEYALYVPPRLQRKHGTDLAALPLALQQSEPELNEQLLALAGKHSRVQAALECETFPQACRAVRSGRYAALLPTIAGIELGGFAGESRVLPRLSRKIHLAWHPRTTRRSDRYAAVAGALEGLLALASTIP